jgi:EAL domain-containing protein (putative c-di-GMP-specific phosphodiesterase class I)
MQEIIRGGGEYGQGFYFGKAMPAAEATQLVRSDTRDPRTLR